MMGISLSSERQRTAVATDESLRCVDAIVDMTDVFDPAVNVVVVRRVPSPELRDDVRRAVAQPSFNHLVAVDGASAVESLATELRPLHHLASDVCFWVEALSELTGAARVGVRITRLESAMCPRMHVDRVTLRAVCTYHGLATEFVAEADVDRTRLGHAGGGLPDETSGLLRRGEAIRRASSFDFVLLKGEAWPGNVGRGAVHRSPPASPASPRLVLTLDLL